MNNFLEERQPVYIDNDTGIALQVTNTNLKDKPFTYIFKELRVVWLNTTRGYLYDNHLILYVNDFEIPNLNFVMMQYLFQHFNEIEWIGLGLHKGKKDTFWEPKLKVYCNDIHNK